MKHSSHTPGCDSEFLGTASLGEKGQIVIPVEGRRELGLEAGDKLVVLRCADMLVLMKPSGMETILNHLTSKVSALEAVLKSTQNTTADSTS